MVGSARHVIRPCHRTIGEHLDDRVLEDYARARAVIAMTFDVYNNTQQRTHLPFRPCGRLTIVEEIPRRRWPSFVGSDR